jgi:hypothetical protein
MSKETIGEVIVQSVLLSKQKYTMRSQWPVDVRVTHQDQ